MQKRKSGRASAGSTRRGKSGTRRSTSSSVTASAASASTRAAVAGVVREVLSQDIFPELRKVVVSEIEARMNTASLRPASVGEPSNGTAYAIPMAPGADEGRNQAPRNRPPESPATPIFSGKIRDEAAMLMGDADNAKVEINKTREFIASNDPKSPDVHAAAHSLIDLYARYHNTMRELVRITEVS